MMIKLRRGAVWDSASIEIKERKRDLLKKTFLSLINIPPRLHKHRIEIQSTRMLM